MRIRPAAPWMLLAMLTVATADKVEAQGWAPISVGARAGWDNKQRNEVVGAHVRIPVLPSGVVELMPNVDVTFLPVFKEYQYNLEAVYMLGDRQGGGLYAGGGVGFRSTIFDVGDSRETVQTFSIVTGVRVGNLGRVNPQIEVRWIFLDDRPVNPQQLTIGVSFSLWSAPPRQG